MFSELLLVFMTFIGLAFVGDYSIVLGVVLFSVLTYLCTCNCLREYVSEESVDGEPEVAKFDFLNRYISSVGNVTRRFVCAVRWSYILLGQTRKVLYILRIIRGSNVENIEESQSTQTMSSQEDSLQQSMQGCSIPLSVDVEVKIVVDCILREYIKSWYNHKISQNTQFVSDVNCVIYETLTAFCRGVSSIKRKKLCCHFIQLYLHFFFHFKEALNKVNCEQQNVLETCVSRKKEICDNFRMHHWAMKDKITEWFYLQSMMTSLIDSYGPVEILSCPILHSVLVEILTRTVMYALVNTLSDPDRVNSWILKLLQNILKSDSESLIHSVTGNSKVSNNIVDNSIFKPSSFEKPVILLSMDDSCKAAQEAYARSRSHDMTDQHMSSSCSSSKLLRLSTEKISDTSTDIFEYNISDTSQNSSQGLVDTNIQTSNNSIHHCLSFSVMNAKATSSQNLSNKSLNFPEVQTIASSNFLDVTRIKRSRSADYIRQMPHMVGLLPLNGQNYSIRAQSQRSKSPFVLRSTKYHSVDVEIAEEAVEKELPPLFTDLQITETQQQEGAGHNPYTLYCIQYIGMFQDISHSETAPTLVRQAVNIKRRFREFLALQSRLEENPSLKRYLKGIKGPSKWQATPFTNLDKKNVAERKPFLEKYLQDLCKQTEISKSPELQEFLAYGGDASIAFVKKSFDITVPRIDKMIARSVKGAFDLFRTALPTPSTEAVTPKEFGSQESELEAAWDEPLPEFEFQAYFDFSVSDPEIFQELETFITNFDDNSSSDSSFYDSNRVPNNHKPRLYHSLSVNDRDSCNCMDVVTAVGSLREENHMANVIIDFIVESFNQVPGPQTTSHIHLIKFLFGSILDSYVTEKLEEISEDKCARLLHSFHKALWPENKQGLKKGNKIPDLPEVLTKIIAACHADFLKTKWFGEQIHYILQPNEVSHAIEMVIGSLQNESLNRCFLFYALDALNQVLCSKDM